MARFTSQQIDQFLTAPSEEKPVRLTEEQLKQNEDQIISRIHSHNVHRRTGWMAAAASVLLIIVAGITIEKIPHRASPDTVTATATTTTASEKPLQALYDVNENTSEEELEEEETLIECDTFLELI